MGIGNVNDGLLNDGLLPGLSTRLELGLISQRIIWDSYFFRSQRLVKSSINKINLICKMIRIALLASISLLLGGLNEAFAQQEFQVVDNIKLTAPAPESICVLHPGAPHEGHYLSIPERVAPVGKANAATIVVTYNGFTPQAQAAFQRAVDTWAALLTSTVPIYVDATFAPLGPGVLGSAGPTGISVLTDGTNFFVFGIALAESLIGPQNTDGDPDITATFSSTFTWHYGIGAPPPGTFDFESVVLHELGHGLNFTRFSNYDDGINNGTTNVNECGGVAGQGCMNLNASPPPPLYGRNDFFFIDAGANFLRNTGIYPDPSAALGTAFTSGVGSVRFSGSNATTVNGGTPPIIYAPVTFAPGSSLSHLDETTFNGTINALMTPQIAAAEVARTPGPVTCALFADLAWTIDQSTCNGLPLPVELTTFDAIANGNAVTLRWETVSETNNAGFEVQVREATDWETLQFVEGIGTTTTPQQYHFSLGGFEPGTHVFRLKQVDFDGTFEYSPEIEVAVEMIEAYRLTAAYPNPFNPTTQFTVAVQRAQEVRVDVYDVTGRQVETIFAGPLHAQQSRLVVFEASDLPSGVYYLRALGETFQASQAVVLMK